MFFWGVGQKWHELWVSIQHADTLDYIPVVKFVLLASDRNFLPNKLRKPIWELFIDDVVEFIGTREGQTKVFDNLEEI